MNALKPRAPFAVLIMSEASRLGREQFETGYALKQLSQAGVRCFSYLDDREIALDTATDKFMMSAATFAAELEREKARQRVTDTMARKARAGPRLRRSAASGTTTSTITGPGRQTLARRAAHQRGRGRHRAADLRVVRERRRLHADRQAAERRARAVARARWADARPDGRRRRCARFCLRPMYRGELVYNTTKKRDQWGQHKTSDRPESDWIRTSAPALRIVSDDVWHAAHARLNGHSGAAWAPSAVAARARHREPVSAVGIRAVRRVRRQPVRPAEAARGRPTGVWLHASYHKRGTDGLWQRSPAPDRRASTMPSSERSAATCCGPRVVMAIVRRRARGDAPETRAADAASLRAELQQPRP